VERRFARSANFEDGEVCREEAMKRNHRKPALNLLTAGALLLSSAVIQTRASYAREALAGAAAKSETTAQTNASEKSQAAQGSLAAGTAINAELDKSLDSKKAKVGDAVSARTTETVKEDGKLLLPKGTKLTGRVTRASARSKGDNDSTLAVQFDRAELKSGQEVAVQLNVRALAAAPGVAPIGGDDLQGMGSAGAGVSAGGNRGGGNAAPVGGAVSGAASTTARTTENTAGAVNSTVNSTANSPAGVSGAAGATTQGATGGFNSSGQLATNSRGVFGLSGLSLNAETSNATQGSVIASSGKSVRLDGGTRMLLVAQANASASAQR
jgi:hypothetical protein